MSYTPRFEKAGALALVIRDPVVPIQQGSESDSVYNGRTYADPSVADTTKTKPIYWGTTGRRPVYKKMALPTGAGSLPATVNLYDSVVNSKNTVGLEDLTNNGLPKDHVAPWSGHRLQADVPVNVEVAGKVLITSDTLQTANGWLCWLETTFKTRTEKAKTDGTFLTTDYTVSDIPKIIGAPSPVGLSSVSGKVLLAIPDLKAQAVFSRDVSFQEGVSVKVDLKVGYVSAISESNMETGLKVVVQNLAAGLTTGFANNAGGNLHFLNAELRIWQHVSGLDTKN